VTHWATIASFATAGGTLVLAVATFSSVRSANRAARVAETSFRIGLRPVLASSRVEDPPQRIMFGDRHWVTLEGARAAVEVSDGVVYLAMLVRNVGNGMAVIEAWKPSGVLMRDEWGHVEEFRPQTRDLWVPPSDVAFWQGALRDETEREYEQVREGVRNGELTIDLLYRDHEGGQRTMSRFSLVRRDGEDQEGGWWASLTRHHNID